MPTYTQEVEIAASPAVVWPIMRDVERWHMWTASITSVEFLSPSTLTVGARARVVQPKLPPAIWQVTRLQANHGFAWESKSPGARMTGGHWIEPTAGGSRVVLSLDFAGPMGALIGRMFAGLTRRYLAMEAAGLKAKCEAIVSTDPAA
jgi:hypothetical protein